MRALPILALLTIVPQTALAADIAVSCALKQEEIVFLPNGSNTPATLSKRIVEKLDLAIAPAALVTSMGAPCDRMAGDIRPGSISVSCAFPSEGVDGAAVKIEIDREHGTIAESWDITEHDGAKSHFLRLGTCNMGEPPALVADATKAADHPTELPRLVVAQEPRRLP